MVLPSFKRLPFLPSLTMPQNKLLMYFKTLIREITRPLPINSGLLPFFSIRLNIPNLGIDDKYRLILEKYGADIDMISKLYTKQKYDPPLARDQPPIAGRILWARQLFHRIEQPMKLFQQHPTVLKTPEAKPVIRSYNRMAKVLLEFEVLYHRAWIQQVSCVFCQCCSYVGLDLQAFSKTR